MAIMGGLADCSIRTAVPIGGTRGGVGWEVPTSMISTFACPSSFVRGGLSLKVWAGVAVGVLGDSVTGGRESVVTGVLSQTIAEVVVLATMLWGRPPVQSDGDILGFGGGGRWSFAVKCVAGSFKSTLEFIFNILLYQGGLLGLSEVSDFLGVGPPVVGRGRW
jgi:hypothetical protein